MELTTQNSNSLSNKEQFDHANRVAKMLAASDLVPQEYRGKPANCIVALNMANRMNADPMAVMQNLHIIHGKPSFSSKFLISAVNTSGKFSSLRYRYETDGTVNVGGKNIENIICIAFAKDRDGEILESPEVSIKMAVAEGWWGKKGSKWPTMTKLMLSYRAAAFFARLYAPELTMGLPTSEESRDIQDPEIDTGYAETVHTDTVEVLNQKLQTPAPTPTPTDTVATETVNATEAVEAVEEDSEEWL